MGLFKRQIACFFCIALCLVLGGASAWAVTWGCEFKEGGELSLDLAICSHAKAQIEAASVSKGKTKVIRRAAASGSMGVHVASYLSGHLSGESERLIFSSSSNGKSSHVIDRSKVDTLALQVGNPVLHKTRLLYGRMRIPFGLQDQELAPIFSIFDNRKLWGTFDRGFVFAIDDLRNRTIEIGFGKMLLKRDEEVHSFSAMPESASEAIALRLNYDVSSLEGTRLIGSVYGMRAGERRFGFALLNLKSNGESTSFEFVRRLSSPDGKSHPFEQALRLSIVSQWRSGRRMTAGVEDERFRFRRGLIAAERQIPTLSKDTYWRLGVVYHKAEDQTTQRGWWAILGVNAGI